MSVLWSIRSSGQMLHHSCLSCSWTARTATRSSRPRCSQHLKETGAIAGAIGVMGKIINVEDLGLSEGIKEVIGQRLGMGSQPAQVESLFAQVLHLQDKSRGCDWNLSRRIAFHLAR